MISVVIPLYNCKKYITRAIESILKQTYLPAEIIVVNDGSSDNGEKLVEEMNHPLIKIINKKNEGVSAARNRGIMEAKNEYIAFLDADDEWLPNHLEIIINLIEQYPSCGLFSTSYYIKPINKDPFLPIVASSLLPNNGVITDFYKSAAYSADTIINMNTFVVKKIHLQRIKGFPLGIPSGEDLFTIAQLYTICDFAYSNEPTAIYYLTPSEGKSIRPIYMLRSLDEMFHSLTKVASHRKNVRLYLASWHKRRVVGAILTKNYKIALKHFFIAITLSPFYKKLYSATIAAIYCNVMKINFWNARNYTIFKP